MDNAAVGTSEIKRVSLESTGDESRPSLRSRMVAFPGNLVERIMHTIPILFGGGDLLACVRQRYNPNECFTSLRPVSYTMHVSGKPEIMQAFLHDGRNSEKYTVTMGDRLHPLVELFQGIFPELKLNEDHIILTCKDSEHQPLRKAVQPTFNGVSLDSKKKEIDQVIDNVIAKWGDNDGVVDVNPLAHNLAAEVVGRVFLGSQREDYTEVADAVHFLVNSLDKVRYQRSPWRQILKVTEFLRLTDPMVDQNKLMKAREVILQECNTLYDHAGEGSVIEHMQSMDFTEEQIKGTIFTLLIAGQETTASTISYLLLKAAQSQELQNFCREGKLSEKAVVAEALRLSTPAALVGRIARERLKCTVEFKNVKTSPEIRIIEPGDIVVAAPYTAARNPDQFEDPNLFNPRRWGDEVPNVQHAPERYFGSGRHECLGKNAALYELEQVLKQCLSKYQLSTSMENEPPLKIAFTAKLVGNVPIQFTQRND